jgi:hypothetical protein
MVGCSIALYAAEHGVNKAIESPLDALWWGIVTLSTVGYGDVYPGGMGRTGRAGAVLLMTGALARMIGGPCRSDESHERRAHVGPGADAIRGGEALAPRRADGSR